MITIKIVYKRTNGLPMLKSATTHPLPSNLQPEMLSRDQEMPLVEEGGSPASSFSSEPIMDLDQDEHVSKA